MGNSTLKNEVESLRIIVAKMQVASSFEKFIQQCHILANRWDAKGKQIAVYLMRIHPRHWTIFGNLETIQDTYWIDNYASTLQCLLASGEVMNEDELSKVENEQLFYNNILLGKKSPLYGICRNNVSESAANSVGMNGVRYATP